MSFAIESSVELGGGVMKKKVSSSLASIVAMLNDGEYHDGTSIGAKLKMTRSAVWKAIKKLQNYGIKIDSIKVKGYALQEPLILLNKKQIKQHLQNQQVSIDIFETLPSTNEYLKNFCRDKKHRVCLAEQQTKGKGRLNRTWHSPFGKNLYFSFLFPLEKDFSELSGLSLVVGLAVVKTLEHFYPSKELAVKWPNDIICQQKKLAGSLIEVQAETNGICHTIIGIGINVNMLEDEEKNITQPWTSLRKLTGKNIDRNQLCALLIDNLAMYLEKFEEKGLTHFLEKWKSVDSLYDKNITLKCVNKKIQGQVKGVSEQGHLLLQLENGVIQAFSSGDASILK